KSNSNKGAHKIKVIAIRGHTK
uniref:Uncharacterized protein n=1 Tax=Amphimedon queenslandica TaxID=400682 RepID=A0A1X7TK60_AMPQE